MRYRLAVFCLMALLLCNVSLASEQTSAPPGVVSDEEYSVYAAVFSSGRLTGIPDDYVALEPATLVIQAGPWKDTDPVMTEDFNLKNSRQHMLEDKFPEPSKSGGIHLRKDSSARESAFDTGRTYVSRVGFSRDGAHALVFVQHVATPESGIGYYVFLDKTASGWVVSGSIVGRIF